MLRHRVIPIVLIDGFSVLKTINFKQRRNLGSPVTVSRTYNTRNVDELILLDIDASKQGRSIDKFTIMDISQELFMPLTVGGGIRTVKDIEMVLKMGADKVAINTEAILRNNFIVEGANEFGRQCIVVSLDVIKVNEQYCLFSHSANKIIEINLLDFCMKVQELGAGELLINNVDKDGLMSEPDFKLINDIAGCVGIPIIAAGGVSVPNDCTRMIQAGASAVAASSLFHFTGYTPQDCKSDMRENNIPVR